MRVPRRGKTAVLIAALALMASLMAPASATRTTLPAEADAFVLSSNRNANRGLSKSLRIHSNAKISYLRFNVPGFPLDEEVSSATLRVYAPSGSMCTLGVEVLRAANDTWGETSITWSNQPGPTGSALSSGNWTSKGYRSFNVTSAVAGAGRVSFVLRHVTGCNAAADADLNSREAAANRPQLVVETAAAPPRSACSDGLDNDADGLTDFPSDPGCTDANDTDETDVPPPGGAKVVAAAGDIVCSPTATNYDGSNPSSCQHRVTEDLLSGADAVLPLGDLQYPDGTLVTFNQAYDPSWGQQAAKTYPAPGNHEYHVPSAQGYFDYWASKGRPTGGVGNGYYSFDLGSWHLISLNSGSCAQVSCADGSPQTEFLEQDLASTTKPCIAAYWHHPLFNSGAVHGDTQNVRPFWDDLYDAGADIVLNGHEHNYQRYAKQTPTGQAASRGIREFIVGAGGKGHYGLLATKDANFEFGNATDFGVLRLQLGNNSYSWDFVNVNGTVLDSGGPVPCN